MSIFSETDLHAAVVRWVRDVHPHCPIVPGLGELQDSEAKRIEAHSKGYAAGQPDLLLMSRTHKYAGLAIELKNPGHISAVASDKQYDFLERLEMAGFKVMVSNSYDDVIAAIQEYMSETYLTCSLCRRTFPTMLAYEKHARRGAARRLAKAKAKRDGTRLQKSGRKDANGIAKKTSKRTAGRNAEKIAVQTSTRS